MPMKNSTNVFDRLDKYGVYNDAPVITYIDESLKDPNWREKGMINKAKHAQYTFKTPAPKAKHAMPTPKFVLADMD